jgi:hypothetical protein
MHDGARQVLRDALHHLQAGLELLDRAGAPGQIGAHVDLAINQLEQALSTGCSAAAMPSDRVIDPILTD